MAVTPVSEMEKIVLLKQVLVQTHAPLPRLEQILTQFSAGGV